MEAELPLLLHSGQVVAGTDLIVPFILEFLVLIEAGDFLD